MFVHNVRRAMQAIIAKGKSIYLGISVCVDVQKYVAVVFLGAPMATTVNQLKLAQIVHDAYVMVLLVIQ